MSYETIDKDKAWELLKENYKRDDIEFKGDNGEWWDLDTEGKTIHILMNNKLRVKVTSNLDEVKAIIKTEWVKVKGNDDPTYMRVGGVCLKDREQTVVIGEWLSTKELIAGYESATREEALGIKEK